MTERAAVRVGTRGSDLALRQTQIVIDALRTAHPHLDASVQVIRTIGDEVKDVPLSEMRNIGVFTSRLEAAVYEGSVDLAVHSAKDLPTDLHPRLLIGAVPARANVADVLISREEYTLATLPNGARVGTSSRRRAAQLLYQRPDLHMLEIRGNVDTRIEKALAPDSSYDAIVLAYAGLERLGRLDVISEVLSLEVMLPAPAQAALAVQCRVEDGQRWINLLQPINDPAAETATIAERALLTGLGGGCALPVAAYAQIIEGALLLRGRVTAPDGTTQLDAEGVYPMALPNAADAQYAGAHLAGTLIERGAMRLLENVQ